jgi:phosphate transport system permease protein
MNSEAKLGARAITARSDSFHRWRGRKDTFAKYIIGLGGLMVIAAVLLILFYLLFVVSPLFQSASLSQQGIGSKGDWGEGEAVYLSIEEQQSIALKVTRDGKAEFLDLKNPGVLESVQLTEEGLAVTAIAGDQANHGLVAVAYDNGHTGLFKHEYRTDFSRGVEQKSIVPALEFPYGRDSAELMPGGGIDHLAFSDSDTGLVVAAAAGDGRVRVNLSTKQENFLSGEVTLERTLKSLDTRYSITGIAVSSDHRWLYLGDDAGRVHFISLSGMEEVQTVQVADRPITRMTMLLGGISLLVGEAGGEVTQLFPVRNEDNSFRLEIIRRFDGLANPVVDIIPEQRRKGFLATDEQGNMAIYHSTASETILTHKLDHGRPSAMALAPRASGLLVLNTDGSADFIDIDNEHPEASFSSLWSKVWYENYAEPEYIWQSSASNNEFEPKFSLTPLVFGTFKAALYAMLFALPLALMGAAFTAYFMSARLRGLVKPTIEIMAALPTVILGFLAGLWFAPYLEENLAGVLSLMIVLPAGLLLFAWFWTSSRWRVKSFVPEGWEPILLLPILIFLGWVSLELVGPLQNLFFGGDLRTWLSQEAGISYDQRNAMVVGCAMGFAVIPTIFSIAEDAIYGVPKTLSDGSLALGATPWQTLVRVILPTASPGMFSAVMIGLGRAVGETMIVLMATGNTPIMDWNLFEGMRTLAANIAVEMPESALNSSHYRILFLAALVLFLFTFVVNTGAELIRQRLREKYSSL